MESRNSTIFLVLGKFNKPSCQQHSYLLNLVNKRIFIDNSRKGGLIHKNPVILCSIHTVLLITRLHDFYEWMHYWQCFPSHTHTHRKPWNGPVFNCSLSWAVPCHNQLCPCANETIPTLSPHINNYISTALLLHQMNIQICIIFLFRNVQSRASNRIAAFFRKSHREKIASRFFRCLVIFVGEFWRYFFSFLIIFFL